jgi:hypothetical protein
MGEIDRDFRIAYEVAHRTGRENQPGWANQTL